MIDNDRYIFKTENWEILESLDVAGATLNGKGVPIPPQTSNVIIDNKLLLILIDHGGVQSTWNYAGQIQQTAQPDIGIGSPFNVTLNTKSLYLNQWNLFVPSLSINDWSLRFIVPKWFPRWVCTVYGYIGPITNDLNDTLQGIKSDIATLQSDFDAHYGI